MRWTARPNKLNACPDASRNEATQHLATPMRPSAE